MKPSHLLFIAIFLFSACQKEKKVSPKTIPTTTTTTPASTPVVVAVNTDTIPDNAGFKLQLAKDSINTDETMLLFNKTASLDCNLMEDGPYFAGNGQVSLASISNDGRDLAISHLPYTAGMSIPLDMHTKTDGAFLLKISYMKNVPANTQVWLKDAYLKASVNVRAINYNIPVTKADTNSFGSRRFKLVIKAKAQQHQ